MKKVMVLFVTVLLCSLSAWSQPHLLELALKLLKCHDDVSKVEHLFEDNGLLIVSKEFSPYVASTYYVTTVNSESIAPLHAAFSNTTESRIAVVFFEIDLESEYYNQLSGDMKNLGFELIKDDGNELDYRNSNKVQCNISFPTDGKIKLEISKRTHTLW